MKFPTPTGIRVLMLPYVQGDPSSLPPGLEPYHGFVREHALQRGELGFLTVDEGHVAAGSSQRGYGESNVHTEGCAGLSWGSPSWRARSLVSLDADLRVLIANSIDDTCAVWDRDSTTLAVDGHVTGEPDGGRHLLSAGEVADIGIFTPHECVHQERAATRQFVRIVGSGVRGREPYFTRNPKVNA